MKVPIVGGVVGVAVVAAGAAVIVFNAAGAHAAPRSGVQLASASSLAGAADRAAVTYVDQHFGGSGTAAVLKTEADKEHGVPVYDVRVKAPNGATYSLSVRASNDSVISAHLAEASSVPAATTDQSGLSSESTQTPTAEPRQTAEPSASTPEADASPTASTHKSDAHGSPDQGTSGVASHADG